MKLLTRLTFVTCLFSLLPPGAAAQPPGAYVPKQSDRAQTLTGEEPGYVAIFDGKSLDGWKGSPTYWRVENGCLVGEIKPETVVKSNTFIIWQGGKPKDFRSHRQRPGDVCRD